MARDGRPTKYNKELAAKICDAVAMHGYGLRKLSMMYEWMPTVDTINQWRVKYNDFSDQYLYSRMKQTHAMFESAVDEVEKITEYYYTDPRSGAVCVDSGIVAAQKAIANQKTHQAARLNPKIYAVNKQSEDNSPTETLSKIQALVADLNKTNLSDV